MRTLHSGPKVLTEQLDRLAELMNKRPKIGGSVKFLLGAIYAMLNWHERDLERQPDQPENMLRALRELNAGVPSTTASFRGFYRNDAAMRLMASDERFRFLVELPEATKNPKKWKCTWTPCKDPQILWQSYCIQGNKLPETIKAVRRAVNAMKHWGTAVEKEEVLAWPIAVKALDDIITYVSEHADEIVAGDELGGQQREAWLATHS